VPGGTVEVVIQLSQDTANTAASADMDIAFPTDLVDFTPPVTDHCKIADRLATTHEVGGHLPQPGLLSLSIFEQTLTIAQLGDGALATCEFQILPDAPLGTAPLTADAAFLFDANGDPLTFDPVDGAITITTTPAVCLGDCNGDGTVSIDELIRGVAITLGEQPLSACPAFDDGSGVVTIASLVKAVGYTLNGCPAT